MPYRNFSEFKKKVRLDFDLDDETYQEAISKVGKALVKEQFQKSPALKKCSDNLIKTMLEWSLGFYSPAEIEGKLQNMEQVAIDFMIHNPKEVSHQEMGYFFGKNGKPALSVSPFEKPFNEGDWELGEDETEIRKKPKVKPQRQPIEIPSERAVREMPLSDLDKLIKDAKESLKDEL